MKPKCFSLEVKSKKRYPQNFDRVPRQTNQSQLRSLISSRASLTLSLSLMLLYLVKLLEPELKLNWIGWSVDASLEYLDCADHLRYRGL